MKRGRGSCCKRNSPRSCRKHISRTRRSLKDSKEMPSPDNNKKSKREKRSKERHRLNSLLRKSRIRLPSKDQRVLISVNLFKWLPRVLLIKLLKSKRR
jgi:hypothetical protein